MRRILSAATALAIGATAAHAQNAAAIAARQETMRAFGLAVRAPSGMVRGDIAFDLGRLRAALQTIQETAAKAKGVFPDDSRTGDTSTLPAAFKSKADLFARFDKLAADAKAAEAAITDKASLEAQWPRLFDACSACHRLYVKRR